MAQRLTRRTRLLLGIAAGALPLCGTAHAQEGAEPEAGASTGGFIDEIVVTAQKREEALSDTPIAITAFGSEQLRDAGVQNAEDLTYHTPNFSMSTFYPSRPEFSIRGVAMSESFLSTDQQPVGVYHDEVFQGSRAVQMMQIFDLERVEIVRGPQGILFGRNTTAGAISFFSKKPGDDYGGFVSAGIGNYGAVNLEGAANVPLSSTLKARFAGNFRHNDGWARNVHTDKRIFDLDSSAWRGLLEYDNGDMTWTVNVHGSDFSSDANYYFSSDIPGLDYDELAQRFTEAPEEIEAFGMSLTGTFSIGAVDVTSITAYEQSDYFAVEDFGHGPTDIANEGAFAQFKPFGIGYRDDFRQYSQEIRFAGEIGRLQWVAGLFAYDEKVDSIYSDGAFGRGTIGLDFNRNGVIDEPTEGFFPEDDQRQWTQTTKSYAAFAHAEFAISDQWSILGGLRYSYDKKELDWTYVDVLTGFVYVPETHLEKSWDAISLRLGVEFQPTDDILLYGRYDRGYKSGGFNVGGSELASLTTVDPEDIDSFELGGKFTLFGGRVQLNAAAFHNEIKNYQANFVIESDTGLGFGFTNAAAARSKGFEFELTAYLTDRLLMTGSYGYTDAVFKSYVDPSIPADYSGNRIPNTPKHSASVSLEYQGELANGIQIVPRVDYSYTGPMEGRHFNNPSEVYKERHLVNGQIRFESPDERVGFTIWGKNLTEEKYKTKILDSPFAGGPMEKRGMPRTYGITLSYDF